MMIDNFLPKDYVNKLEELFSSKDFEWYYNKSTVSSNIIPIITKTTKDTGQFVHGYFKDGVEENGFDLLIPIIETLEKITNREYRSRLLRAKVNMLVQTVDYPDNFHNRPHCDISGTETETLLYYVNTSDGDTFIFNEKNNVNGITINYRQSPKKGSAILFDSTYLHASSPPRASKYRIIINFVFKK